MPAREGPQKASRLSAPSPAGVQPGVPMLVMCTRACPSGLDGSPARIDSRPMLIGAGNSLAAPRRGYGQSWSGELRSLVLAADIAPDGALTRWRAEYRPREPQVVDEAGAAAMYRTLFQLRDHLVRLAARHGPPADFPDYLARASAALGIPGTAPFAVYVPVDQGGPEWRRLGADGLRRWLPGQACLVAADDPGIG